jgi:hypothetical protein
VATADDAVPTGPMNIHLDWLTSVFSNYLFPGSILGKKNRLLRNVFHGFSQFRVCF